MVGMDLPRLNLQSQHADPFARFTRIVSRRHRFFQPGLLASLLAIGPSQARTRNHRLFRMVAVANRPLAPSAQTKIAWLGPAVRGCLKGRRGALLNKGNVSARLLGHPKGVPGSEPALPPPLFVGQLGPTQGDAVVGQHSLQYELLNPVGR